MSKKILIVGPAWVGDMVMAQCLFKLIKHQQPENVIEVFASAWSLPLLSRMPEISETIIMPLGHGQLGLHERYRLGKTLQNKYYDQAIILPNSFKSALIPWWANIPVRTGWHGEMRYFLLNDRRILDKKKYPLMIERFMALGLSPNEALPHDYPIPDLQISLEKQSKALANHHLDYPIAPVLALCPGAEFGPAKRWPEHYYADIANTKLEAGWQVWILGSPKDRDVSERIMQLTHNRCVNLTGQTTLEEAIDLLALTTTVVSNDSGLMHIAAALKKPLIAVYGPTSAGFTPPLHQKAIKLSAKIECQPCFLRTCPLKHHRCMLELKPHAVLTAISEVML